MARSTGSESPSDLRNIPAMAVLTAGTRLGTYQIVGPLGAGGMGEAYRAGCLWPALST